MEIWVYGQSRDTRIYGSQLIQKYINIRIIKIKLIYNKIIIIL